VSTRTSARAVAFARLAIAALLLISVSAGLHAQTCTAPAIVQQGGPVPVCPGSAVTLDAGPGWVTYAWSNGATGQTMTATPMMTTSYTVTVTDASNCTVTSQPYEVVVEPVTLVVNAPFEVCPVDMNEASVEPPPGGGSWVSVSWTIEHGWFDGQTGQSTAAGETVSFSADESGQPAVLTVTAYDGHCTTVETKTVGIREIAPPVINAPLEICPMGAQTQVSVAPPPGGGDWMSVAWEITNGHFYGPNGSSTVTSGSSATFSADGSGLPVVLHVQVWDGEYCSSEATTTVGLRVIAPPVINAPLEICPMGASGTASVAPPAEGGAWYSVSWEITNGYFASQWGGPSTFASGTEVNFWADNSGQPVVLSVQAYDGEYCTSQATKTVGIREIAPPVINAPLEVCPMGASGTASVAPPAEGGAWYNVSWEITNGSFSGQYGASPFASGTEVIFWADNSGQPVVLRARAYDGQYCQSEATKTVGIRTIAPPVINAPLEICPMGTSGTASVAPPAEGGAWYNVSWEITNGTFQGLYGPSAFAYGTEVAFWADNSGQPVVLRARAFDGQYCQSEATKTVGIRTIAPPVITAPATVCITGSGTASVAPPAEGGAWYNVGWEITNGTFSGGSAFANGEYVMFYADGSGNPVTLTVQAYDGEYCHSQGTKTVAISIPNATITAGGPTTFCPGGNVQLTASAGASYLWSTGATTQSIWASNSGDYTVTVTDANGCSATSAPVTVIRRDVEVPQIVTIPTYCAGSGNQTATATGGAPVTYLWQILFGATIVGPSNGPTLTYTSSYTSGSMVIRLITTDAQGCTVVSENREVPISNPQAPLLNYSTAVCADGAGFVQVYTPNAGSTWQWSITNGVIDSIVNNQTGLPDPNGDRITFHPTVAGGNVSVTSTETNAAGCSKSSTVQVPVTPVPQIDFTITPACPGGPGSAVASSNPPLGHSFFWALTNATITIGQGARTLNYVATGSDPVTIALTITNNNSWAACSNTVTKVSPIQTIAPPTINKPSMACPGASHSASVSLGSQYDQITWSIQNGTITNAVGSSVAFTAGQTGEVSLTALVRKGTCLNSSTVTVPIANPDFTAPASMCPEGTITISYPTGYSNYDVDWDNALFVSSGNNTYTFRPDGSGQPITITVGFQTSVLGCWIYKTKVIPIVQTEAPVIEWNVPANFCAGMTGSATISNREYASYAWSVNGGTITGPANGSTINFVWSNASSNFTASVNVVDERGCSASGGSSSPQANVLSVVNTSGGWKICPGQTRTLTASQSNADTYLWSNGATTQSIVVNTTGDYSVTTTRNGCALTSPPYHLEVVTPVVNVTTPSGTSYCSGSSRTLNATYSNGTGNTPWFELHAASNGAYLGGNYSGVFTISSTSSAGYFVRVIEDFNSTCVTNSSTVNFTVNPLPPATITPNGPTTFCQGGSVTLSAPAGMSSYSWSNGATTQAIAVSQSGNYTVTVTNSNGCTASSSRSVTVNPLPSATITPGGPTTFCEGGSVTLTASAGQSWLWSNGATTQSINVTQGGAYTVTVTQTGCSATSAATNVTVNARPSAVVTADGPTTFCEGGSVTLTAPESSSYSWSTGATTRSITVDASGAYSVTVTNAAGCSATSTPVAVTENAFPATPVINAGGPTTFCQGGSVTLTAPAGFTYLWSTGATTQSIDVNASGDYSVSVTNASGCTSASAPVTVTVNPLPAATITPSGATTFCAGGSVTLTASAGASYLWSNGATTQSIDVNASGSYSVTVTSAAGCSATSAATSVTVNALPAATVTAGGPTTFCEGGSVTLSASAGASYLWSNGATTQSIAVSASGSYSVTVTNANGCSATSAATSVTVNALPVATITAGGPTTFCAGGSVTLTASAGSSYLWSNGATTQSIEVSASGSYSVTVTNANGCSATSAATSVTVDALPAATVTAGGPTTFCEGGSVTLTASAGSSYLWSTGATTQSIDVYASGSYSVTVTNANGCSATSAATSVTVDALPVPAVTAGGPATFCEGGSVTLTASAGSSYLWSNGATTQSIDVTASGSYSVTVTNAAGCSATSAATTVTVQALPAATITPSGPTTFCEGGSVTLSASTGSSYLWSNGATTQSIVVNASGSFSVTVTNANGCSAASAATSVTVNALPVATVTAGGPTTFCSGGSVTLTASAGSSYLWSNGATTQAINVTSSGNYSVTVTNAAGCSATSTATTVTVNALPAATITAGGATTFCEGGSVTLTASAGASYLWSNGATTQSIVVNASGSYSVTVTNASGCSATSAATGVTVNPLPTPSISASGPTTFCQGGSVTLTGQGGTPSGAWYRNGSLYSTQGSLVVTSSATFVYRVQTAAGCAADSAPTVVTVNPLPSITSAGGNGRICANETVWWQLDNPTPGATIVWTVTGGVIVSGQNEARLYYHSDGVAESVHLDALLTHANGCTKTFSYDIPVDRPTPTISAGGPATFCAGGSVTLTASAAPSGWTYYWSTGATTQSINVSATGNYTVRYRSATCNAPLSAPVTVTVNPLPSATITPSGPTTFCAGGSVTLTASAGASWLWSNGATTQSINVTTGGSYSVTVTSAAGCSATSAATAVTVNALPSAAITPSGPTTFCAGGSVTLTASAGSSYLWSNGATTQAINVTSSGNYSVTVTNAAGCSATSAATAVTVNALPTATITPSGPTTFCTGGSVTLTASAGSSYLWSTGATTQAIDVNSSGSYSVTVTDAAGCSATSSATTVTVNALPAASITPSGPTTFCTGGSVTLTASAGSSYLWSNGATTQAIDVTSSGNYSVTVTNAAGCSATSAATAVTVNALPAATITPSGPTTFCTGGSVTLTASAGSSYLWSTGATTQAIDVNSSGSYSVTVTNAAGCSATSAATAVTVNALPTATITPSGATTFCAGDSVTLTASAGSSYLWSTGATTQAINVTSSGNYSVTVTNAAGCSATSSATTVTVNALPTATITPSGATTFCAGGSVTLTASAGSSYLWSTGATTQAINVTSSGNYSVTVTNAAGCSATSTATTVTVNALPTATITPSGATTFCAGGSVTLTASAGSSYLWSTGATTQAINVTSSGNYSVTVTNANGCSATSTATTVTVNALPTATITPSGATTFCAGGSVTMTASAGSSYLWSTGATTQAINVTTGGNYTVTVTNAAGCSATSAPQSVTVNANPSTPTVTAGGPTTFCAGGSVTLSAPAGFTYLWSTGAITQSINVTTSGNYTVTVTNASGCSAVSAPTSVTVNAATAISQHPQSITIPKGTGTTLTVIASGSGTLTYQWYKGTSPTTTQPISGATNSSYSTGNLTKGTYKYWVRVTGTCGVVNSNTATVTAN